MHNNSSNHPFYRVEITNIHYEMKFFCALSNSPNICWMISIQKLLEA